MNGKWTVWAPAPQIVRNPKTGEEIAAELPSPVFVPVDFLANLSRHEAETVARLRFGEGCVVTRRKKREPPFAAIERLRPEIAKPKQAAESAAFEEFSYQCGYDEGYSAGVDGADAAEFSVLERRGTYDEGFRDGEEEGREAIRKEQLGLQWWEAGAYPPQRKAG